MPRPRQLSGLDWINWEVDPSTRTSVHVWTKWVPVDVTLATPGTAENLFQVSPGEPTINLVTNPSFETGDPPTGYTAVGSTLARSATVANSGTYSLSITPDNAAVGEGGYWTTDDSFAGGPDNSERLYLVASVYLQDNVDSGDDARIVITDADGTTLANGDTITLSSSWQRSTAFYPLSTTGQQYRVYIVTVTQHGTVFYADDLQVEIRQSNTASTYCDGAQGLNYFWDGTAHASMSRRRRGLSTIRGYTLHNTRNLYIAFDHTASSTLGEYKRAGTDFWGDHPLDVFDRISFINELAGEQPRLYGQIWGVHEGLRQGTP